MYSRNYIRIISRPLKWQRIYEFVIKFHREYTHNDSPKQNFYWLRPSDAYMRRKLTIIGSDNGLSPDLYQVIIWTSGGRLLIGINSSEIWIEIHTLSLKKMDLKMSFGKRRPFFLGLSVLVQLVVFMCMFGFLSSYACRGAILTPNDFLNTLRPRQNGCHFADYIFTCIFFNENVWISIIISFNLFLRFQLIMNQHWLR